MKIEQFAVNEIVFYHQITTGDTVSLTLTNVTYNQPKTVNPIIQTRTDNWFLGQVTTVTGSTMENLTGGTIYLQYGGGYYDYDLKINNVSVESSQVFVQGPANEVIENDIAQTTVITNPYAGSSGTSGQNATAGSAGSSGSAGTTGSSGSSASSGTAGANGSSGSSGANGSSGTSGQNGTSGVVGPSGSSGTSASSGSSGANGSSGSSGSSGNNGTNGVSGSSGSSASSGLSGSSGTSGADGITAGRTYYFNQSQNSDVSGYKVVSPIPSGAAQQTVTTNLTGNQQNVLVQQFITPQLGFSVIPGGTQRFHAHNLKQASNDQIQMYVTIQLADSSGTGIGPVLSTGNSEIGWVDASTPVETTTDLTLTTTTIDPTNRMIVKIYYSNNDNTSHNVVFYTEGTAYYSFINTTVGATASTSGTSGMNGTSGTVGPAGSSGTSGANGSSGSSGSVNEQDLFDVSSQQISTNLARGFNFLSLGSGTREANEYYQLTNDSPGTGTLATGTSTSNAGNILFIPIWLHNIPSFRGIGINCTTSPSTSHVSRMALYTSEHSINNPKNAFGYTITEAQNGIVFNQVGVDTNSQGLQVTNTTLMPYTTVYPTPKDLVFYTDVLTINSGGAGVYKPGIYNSSNVAGTTTPITLPYNGLYFIMLECSNNDTTTQFSIFPNMGFTQAYRAGRLLVDTRNFMRYGIDRAMCDNTLGFGATVASMSTYTPPVTLNSAAFLRSFAVSTTSNLTNTRTNPPLIWIRI